MNVHDNPLRAIIKRNIAEVREALGWTQQDLAVRLGVGVSTVSAWESEFKGSHGITIDRLSELSEVFGVPPEHLVRPNAVKHLKKKSRA